MAQPSLDTWKDTDRDRSRSRSRNRCDCELEAGRPLLASLGRSWECVSDEELDATQDYCTLAAEG